MVQKRFIVLALIALIVTPLIQAETVPLDQGYLLHNIAAYITKEASKLPKKQQAAMLAINDTVKPGLCGGLSGLWLYAKRLTYKNNKEANADDLTFFNTNYKLIATWDGVKNFTPSEKKEIDRFINHLLLFYGDWLPIKDSIHIPLLAAKKGLPTHYQDAAGLLEFSTGKKIIEHFHKELTLNKNQFKQLLAKLKKPKGMMSLIIKDPTGKTGGHAVALYQTPTNKLCFYDPNHPQGELENTTVDTIIAQLWKYKEYWDNQGNLKLRLQLFNFVGD